MSDEAWGVSVCNEAQGDGTWTPGLVFDRQERLHLPLTAFAKEAVAWVADRAAQTYLRAILPFFTYLEADERQDRAGRRWNGPPGEVRQAVDDYLVQHLRCPLVNSVSATAGEIQAVLEGEDWVPQVVDDPTSPAGVLTGGRRLKGWGLREEC